MGTVSIGEMSVGIPIHCFRRFTTGTFVLVGRGLVCQLTSSNILCVKKYTLSTNRGEGGRGGGHVAAVRKWSHQWCVSLTPNNTETIERMTCHCFLRPIRRDLTNSSYTIQPGGGSLEILVWECASGTSEPLVYTRPISAEFCYPLLELTPKLPPYPRVTIFQKRTKGVAFFAIRLNCM